MLNILRNANIHRATPRMEQTEVNSSLSPQLLARKPRALDQRLELRPHDRWMHPAIERALRETAVGARHDVSRPSKLANRWMRSDTSSGCSTTLVAWLMTPGIRMRPAGSLTSFQTCHSCSCRGLADLDHIGAGAHLEDRSTMSFSGTSLTCGPGQLPQQI